MSQLSLSPAYTPIQNANGHDLKDYEILEIIGHGTVCTVYLVTCKRGRLRNRQLALKKIPVSSSALVTELVALTSSLHQPLFHPSIVSLLATFSTSIAHFQVLELCSSGALVDFLKSRNPPTLVDSELRGVIKSMVDGLLYLKKESVVHGNINPSNLLLTSDGRIKLSNFGFAACLSSSSRAIAPIPSFPNYIAPEILSRSQYNCNADLWSLGCLIFTCLCGKPPFHGETDSEICDKVLCAKYTLPDATALPVRYIITNLIQRSPPDRISLAQIASHAFLDSNLPNVPLDYIPSKVTGCVLDKHALFESSTTPKLRQHTLLPFPPKPLTPKNRGRYSYAPRKRVVLGDLGNSDLRNLLQEALPTRRIVSDPLPRARLMPVSRLSPPSQGLVSSCIDLASKASLSGLHDDIKAMAVASQPMIIPVGTTRPSPLDTSLLAGQTHKTANGQIILLPSCSLLVDFREGERRRGQKGTEVLVISPCGTRVKVYAAPHLSTPCCLAEPVSEYALDALPLHYWKQYNDANRLVGQIKQRTPKLVMYESDVKCTLMANAPQGDVELIFGSFPPAHSRVKHNSLNEDCTMRIRFSRQCRSIEIARYISGTLGKEWTKKVLSTGKALSMSSDEWENLDSAERRGMEQLARFLQVCETVESLDSERLSTMESEVVQDAELPLSAVRPVADDVRSSRVSINGSSATVTTVAKAFSSVNVAPRPQKLTMCSPPVRDAIGRMARHWDEERGPIPVNQRDTKMSQTTSPPVAESLPTWCRHNDFETTTRIHGQRNQTRFIPSVGWCIRHGSKVSQGGRYRIMFFDGAALEIDVDEEWAEFIAQSGETIRYDIRDCHSKRDIGERMKVFEEFVSMFDEESR